MIHKIFKYPIPVENYFELLMPYDAKVLTVQVQREVPQIWALTNPNNRSEVREFRMVGTGHPIEESLNNLKYIGSFQLVNETLMYHLFEIILPR